MTDAPPPSRRRVRWLLATLALLLAVRLALAAQLGLVADEAYYWTWSRALGAGYFDHPPGVAWCIAASERILGATPLGVRAACIVAGVGALGVLLPHARDRGLLVVLLGGMPILALGGLFATPDVPLVLGWSVALAGALAQRWWWAGLGVGIAALGKLTGWGFWPLLVLACPREVRSMLPAMLLSLIVASPHLAWLVDHAGLSVGFQFRHGLGGAQGTSGPPGWAGLAAFLGAQVGLATPVVAGAAVAWAATADRSDRATRILVTMFVGPLAFFAFAATRAHGEANWAVVAWLAAAVGLARAGGRLHRAAWVGGGIAALLSGAVLVHAVHPLVALPRDPAARLGEGKILAQSVEAWGLPVVYTERYQEAAMLRYYAGIDAWALPGVGRPDQFDLWAASAGGVPAAETALFVRPWRSGRALPTDAFCARSGERHEVVEYGPNGAVSGRWEVVEVSGCRP